MHDLDNKRMLTSAQVRNIFGGISDMSLWRWLNDPDMNFPQPIYIQRRRFFDAAEVESFRVLMTLTGATPPKRANTDA